MVLDLTTNATEYLRTLNALLAEFESYQSIHPPDGTSASSLSRGRIPQMFKRAAGASKGRRASTVAELNFPGMSGDSDAKSLSGSTLHNSTPSFAFPSSENDLLPGEEYTHLLTPSLPFEPGVFETFATLCDVLIDCYTKAMSLISTPETCAPGVVELFTKADAKIRKIIVASVVREFEDAGRAGVKSEVAGVGKVVLGGLM